MPTISDEEFLEFERLRRHYGREAIRLSTANVQTLAEDIDHPIKRCVMALALLGCDPVWSCCGFDYEGQPIHKDHQYGTVGIALQSNRRTYWLIEQWKKSQPAYSHLANRWSINFADNYGVPLAYLTCNLRLGNTWPEETSPHFYEPGAIAIRLLEDNLQGLQSYFRKQVVLRDSNGLYKWRFPTWDYPAKTDWAIRKAELMALWENTPS